jgi:hypothetical protein
MKYDKLDEARFWSKVDVRKSKDSCWYWKNPTHTFGYGTFSIGYKVFTAHRLALIFFTGEEKKDKMVLHSCDNPSCVNPRHLRWGTAKENTQDCIDRGRKINPPRNGTLPPVNYGEDNPISIMTKNKVKQLREDYSKGNVSHSDLAKKYGISKSTVGQIVNFKSWKYI